MPIAVIGAGSIGAAFSLIFAAAGHDVRLYEAKRAQRKTVRQRISEKMLDLQQFGLLDLDVDDVLSRIHIHTEIADAVSDVDHVQECVPENLDLKRELFAELDELTPNRTVLASSSSAITTSEFTTNSRGKTRCLVAHPANPPYLIRVIEIVPAPFTLSLIHI